jgi:serine/threonine protein kinase
MEQKSSIIGAFFDRREMTRPREAMITFACPSCGKRLNVGPELCGKRARCPHCQRVISVPATVLHGDSAARPTDAPSLVHEAGTETPSDVKQQANDLHSWAAVRGQDRRLLDFLVAPQQPDELGRLGAYRVLRVLGHGGMGVVFEAEDPQLRRRVALKAMLPELAANETARQRFLREAQSAAAVEHDNIVPIYQVGEDRGVPYIAMPFLRGEPLNERLARQGRLPFQEVLRVGRETAAGLAAAHRRGLIHRDIKPANLWLEEESNRVKILDFGLARAAADTNHLTQAGLIVGTPAYMAPEQVNALPLDARCDLFSLGCVLYELSTGELPFKGRDPISTLMAVATEAPPAPCELNPSLPLDFSRLVMDLLAKAPGDRLRSAEALLELLNGIESERAAATKSYAGPLPQSSAPTRPTWLLLGGLAAGILLIVLVSLWASGVLRKRPLEGLSAVAAEPVAPTASTAAKPLLPFDRMGIVRVGQWRVEGDQLIQEDTTTPYPDIYFGDFEWTDYDFNFQVRRTKGTDLFALHCRSLRGAAFKFQAGSFGSRQSQLLFLEKGVWTEVRRAPFPVQNGVVYKVTLRVRGNRYQAIINGRVIADYRDPAKISGQGRVGLGANSSAYRFTNIEVRSATGKLLWTGPPELDPADSAGAGLLAAAGLEDVWPAGSSGLLLPGSALVGANTRENGTPTPYRIDVTTRTNERFDGIGTGVISNRRTSRALTGIARESEVTFEINRVLTSQPDGPVPVANGVAAFTGKLEYGRLEGRYASHDGNVKGALRLNLAAVYTGTYALVTGAPTKGAVRIEITARQGAHFKGTLTTDDGPATWNITGSVLNDLVQWQWGDIVSQDGCSVEHLTNNCRFTGTCKEGNLEGRIFTLDNSQEGTLRATSLRFRPSSNYN